MPTLLWKIERSLEKLDVVARHPHVISFADIRLVGQRDDAHPAAIELDRELPAWALVGVRCLAIGGAAGRPQEKDPLIGEAGADLEARDRRGSVTEVRRCPADAGAHAERRPLLFGRRLAN